MSTITHFRQSLACLAILVAIAAAQFSNRVFAAERGTTIVVTPSAVQGGSMGIRKVEPQYTVFPTPAGQPATFSGRVVGLNNYGGSDALVGIVYLSGVFWNSYDNYQWASVRPDGSFSITADRSPGCMRALVVQQPGKPWTFLRHDFSPGDSAKDVVIQVGRAHRVLLEVEDAHGRRAAGGFQVEVFDGMRYVEPSSKSASYERLGFFFTDGPQSQLPLYLPSDPVALYVAAPGLSPFYKVIDPTKSDRIVFRLSSAGSITGRVVKAGSPVAGASVLVGCSTNPLSWRTAVTDARGDFSVSDLAPGRYTIRAASYSGTANVREGISTVVHVNL